MDNNLKIKIIGSLNVGATIGQINAELRGIEKKISSIKLKIDMDQKVAKTLSDFSRAMENHKKIAQDLNRIIKEEKTVTKQADGVIKEKVRQHLKSGEIIEKETKKINEQTKAIRQQEDATRRLTVEREKLANKLKETTKLNAQGKYTGGTTTTGDKFNNSTLSYNANNQITSQRIVQNYASQEVALEKLRQKLQQLNNAGTITASSFTRMSNAINGAKTEKEINKIEQALNRVNQRANTNSNLDIFRRQAQLNVQNIQRTHGGYVDNTAIQNYLSSVNALSSRTPNLTQQMRNLNVQFREISANARSAAGAAQQAGMSLGEMMSTAMTKFPIWMISATA